MGLIRPATPGFIVTLVATILLAIVSFCVPYFKSVYFLKASISVDSYSGNITFGTLGYCLELSNGTSCSKPSVGYELDINSLVGNELPIEIPTVVVKWITYALVLHIVALALAAGSALFGLLAHIREMSMTCCSTCVSGFAATIALLAFIFDLVLFFVAKSRLNDVGTAEMGNAIWLTLAAWVLLFFSGCFYTIGRCCVSKRRPRSDWDKPTNKNDGHAEQLRLDAVKAEADRKARQKEGGLPAFHETQPLTARVDGDHVYVDESSPTETHAPAGYVKGAQGTRAVDDYYNQPATASSYPPQQPRRQGSAAQSAYAPSTYASSAYTSNAHRTTSPPPMPGYGGAAAPAAVMHNAPASTGQYLSPHHSGDQYGQDYGHTAGGTTYHSAASHQQYPSAYSYNDPYGQSQPQGQAYGDPYDQQQANAYNQQQSSSYPQAQTSPYGQPQANPYIAQHAPERSYTLGGDGYGANNAGYDPYGANAAYSANTNGGYGANAVPPLPDSMNQAFIGGYGGPQHASPTHSPAPQMPSTSRSPPPAPMQPHVGYSVMNPSQDQSGRPTSGYEDAPPGYDQDSAQPPGAWNSKR
ncbi:SUR7/PalI family-domain-containing protein [Schizophyllum amplum]|uniref:SUR7/PalI family-domain-containing protein n=1 Tax=Schizophyllum amplum TaxID=97359 RepID=A0A550CMU7_9AGAR|nr:SUR7/PalI family-domain-containing protein [Auriculariopsis ampla]